MKICPSCSTEYSDEAAVCPQDGSALSVFTGFEPGTVIRKKYKIENEIARGGMGVVYRARHLLFNEEKAIKLLLNVKRAGGGPSQGERADAILREALVLRQLQHPNIVRVEDVEFTEDDQLFLVMELVDGFSLRQRMFDGPLPWEQALNYTAQACAGLAAAHEKGIIHRDIKPQNLLLTNNADGSETLKLIDFGIAKVHEATLAAAAESGDATVTSTGAFMGTPQYASPEQAMGTRGAELDARTDIYSLGLVLYEMLTGARPFQTDSMVASLVMRVQTNPTTPKLARPDLRIPQAVSDLVMKAVAKEKDARFATAEEMRAAIEVVRSAPQATIAEPEEIPAPRRKSGHFVWIALAAAAIIGIGWWFFGTRRTPVRESAAAIPFVTTAPVSIEKAVIAKAAETAVTTPAAPVRKEIQPKAEGPAPETATNAKTKVNPQDGLTYVRVAPGTFMMGCSPADTNCSDDEKPAHEVTLSKGFWMGETEVTQAAFERVIGVNPSAFKGASLPVDSVNWPQANNYCKAVDGRLPTEAEWEFGARGGLRRARYANPGEASWWRGNSDKTTHEPKQKLANAYGLYDLLGNVAEWTADWYTPYADGAVTDPRGAAMGEYRVLRGGSWLGGVITLRASSRVARKPGLKVDSNGFRCASD